MVEKENLLAQFVSWKQVNTWWLHFIWTPDTKLLVESTRERIQLLLDLAHKNAEYPSTREKVTTEIIESYKKFACWESISTLDNSVRWKHVYYFSDPSWDFQEEACFTKEELITQLSNYCRNNQPDNDWVMDLNTFTDLEIDLFIKNANSELESTLNDKLMHDLFTLSAIKTHWAKSTNFVQWCIPYARQDDMTPKKRQPASLEFIGNKVSSITWKDGNVITSDIHNNSAARWVFPNTKFINLYTGWFIEKCRELIANGDIVLSPADQWWDKKIQGIAKDQKLSNMIVVKSRDYTKEQNSEDWNVDSIDVYWDIEGKDVLIHDDMLDTGWTMCTLLREMLKKKPKSINVAVTHGMFNWAAIRKLEEVIAESDGVIQNIYMTNSINKQWMPDFIKQVDMSNILANNILRIYKDLWLERNDNQDYQNYHKVK